MRYTSRKSTTPTVSLAPTTFADGVFVRAASVKLIVRLATSFALRCGEAVPVSVSVATVDEVFVRTAVKPAGTLATV